MAEWGFCDPILICGGNHHETRSSNKVFVQRSRRHGVARGGLAKAAIACLVLIAAVGVPGKAHALKRLSSQFIDLNGEVNTVVPAGDNATGGAAFYDVRVAAPCTANVLYATVSGTGDVQAGPPGARQSPHALLLACLVDGTACNSSKGMNNTGRSGWTVVQGLQFSVTPGTSPFDLNFHYTWCVPIKPSCPGDSDDASPVSHPAHSVQLRFAPVIPLPVFIEQIYVNIDSERIKNSALACTQGSP